MLCVSVKLIHAKSQAHGSITPWTRSCFSVLQRNIAHSDRYSKQIWKIRLHYCLQRYAVLGQGGGGREGGDGAEKGIKREVTGYATKQRSSFNTRPFVWNRLSINASLQCALHSLTNAHITSYEANNAALKALHSVIPTNTFPESSDGNSNTAVEVQSGNKQVIDDIICLTVPVRRWNWCIALATNNARKFLQDVDFQHIDYLCHISALIFIEKWSRIITF